MDSTKALTLATSRNLNGHTLNCYVENNSDDNYDFWATRTQIGEFLGYADPRIAVKLIHKRNKERLDKFSKRVQIDTTSSGKQNTTIYSFKGLLEICRFSNQPNANKVIDVLWDIADEIRKTGAYSVNGDMKKQLHKLEAENILLREKVDAMLEQPDRKRSAFLMGYQFDVPFTDQTRNRFRSVQNCRGNSEVRGTLGQYAIIPNDP